MGKIVIKDLSHISEAAEEFAKVVSENRIVAFYGSMGAGKTTFITALCKVLGVDDVVNSPTFTIVNEYRTHDGLSVYHFDFYRIKKLEEVMDLGFDEYVYGDGICLMEWPENIEEILPDETLKVKIEVGEDESRTLLF